MRHDSPMGRSHRNPPYFRRHLVESHQGARVYLLPLVILLGAQTITCSRTSAHVPTSSTTTGFLSLTRTETKKFGAWTVTFPRTRWRSTRRLTSRRWSRPLEPRICMSSTHRVGSSGPGRCWRSLIPPRACTDSCTRRLYVRAKSRLSCTTCARVLSCRRSTSISRRSVP
jgi:hypothetical protein